MALTWRYAHGHQIEDANDRGGNADDGVNWVLRVEDQQRDKDHEEALAMLVAEELKILEDGLDVHLCEQDEQGEWNHVHRQQVEEWVVWRVLASEVHEADNCGGEEPEDCQVVENCAESLNATPVNFLVARRRLGHSY